MTVSNFNIALILRADVGGAKAGLTDVTTGLKQLSAEAVTAGAGTAKQAAELERMAAASVKAMAAQDGLVAAEKRAIEAKTRALIGPVANPSGGDNQMRAAFTATETAAGSLQRAVGGLSVTIGSQAKDMVAAAQSAQVFQASLDDVRASFNPLFAASRQYEQQLERIATAESLGAINAREAAAARVAAANGLAPAASGLGGKGKVVGNYTGNIAAQGFDIGVTSAMGMNPLTIGLQQGSQLVGVMQQMGGGAAAAKGIATGLLSILSPASLATIALVTLGAAGIQWLMGLKKETKTFGQNVEDLTATLGRMKTNLDLVQNIRLGDTFGNMAADVKGLAQGMLELDRASELKQLTGVIDSFLNKEVKESWIQKLSGGIGIGATPIPGLTVDDYLKNTQEAKNYKALGAANSYGDFTSRIDELKKLSNSGDIDGVVEKLLALQKAMSGGGSVTGMKDELRALLSGLGASAVEIAKVNAAWDGSARDKILTRQTDQMVLAYRQQSELAVTETQFGKASLEVDQLRQVQARELLTVRMAEQGILADSANGQRLLAAFEDQQLTAAKQLADEKARQVTAMALGYRQDAELANVARQFGQDSIVVERVRARQAQDALDLRLTEMGVAKDSAAWTEAHTALLDQQLQRELDIVSAKKEAVRDQLDKLDGMRREITLIGASNAEQARANALAEADIEIRKRKLTGLEAVLERMRALATVDAEIERDRQKALSDITNQRVGDGYDAQIAAEPNPVKRATLEWQKEYASQIADGADASVAAASADRVRARAMQELTQSQQGYLHDQTTRLQQMQLELALIGQTAAVRARVLALVQAEQDIRRLGATGDTAAMMRRNAVLEAEGTRFIERQADAWKQVQSAGESAIDSVLDKLKAGDVDGAISDFIGEIEKGFFDLAVRNPLKNALFGGNLGTLDDLGGISGIFDRLTGKAGVDEAALVASATASVQSMTVTATTVTIGGIGLQSFLGQAEAANLTNAPFGMGTTGASAAFLQSVAVGGGARPDAISGLNQAFADPLAAMIGDVQKVFGAGAVKITSAFRSVERQQELWEQALQKYGSPEIARQNVAPPGKSRHNFGLAADLDYSSPQVESWMHKNANRYGLNYRMSNEDWHIEPQNSGAMMAGRQLNVAPANKALQEFGTTATSATLDLGTLGEGMGGFGKALASGLQGLSSGGTQGGLTGFLGSLAGSIAKSIGLPGFAEGGPTGGTSPGEVRGVVHGKEFVFDAAATSRIGVANLENLRRGAVKGYARGGYVGADPILTSLAPNVQAANQPVAPASSPMSFVINDYSGQKVEASQGTDSRGQPQITMTIGQQAAAAVSQRGNPLRRAMQSEFAMTPAVRQRG